MKTKYSYGIIKGFSSPIRKAEREWGWWGLFVVVVAMVVAFVLEVYR